MIRPDPDPDAFASQREWPERTVAISQADAVSCLMEELEQARAENIKLRTRLACIHFGDNREINLAIFPDGKRYMIQRSHVDGRERISIVQLSGVPG